MPSKSCEIIRADLSRARCLPAQRGCRSRRAVAAHRVPCRFGRGQARHRGEGAPTLAPRVWEAAAIKASWPASRLIWRPSRLVVPAQRRDVVATPKSDLYALGVAHVLVLFASTLPAFHGGARRARTGDAVRPCPAYERRGAALCEDHLVAARGADPNCRASASAAKVLVQLDRVVVGSRCARSRAAWGGGAPCAARTRPFERLDPGPPRFDQAHVEVRRARAAHKTRSAQDSAAKELEHGLRLHHADRDDIRDSEAI